MQYGINNGRPNARLKIHRIIEASDHRTSWSLKGVSLGVQTRICFKDTCQILETLGNFRLIPPGVDNKSALVEIMPYHEHIYLCSHLFRWKYLWGKIDWRLLNLPHHLYLESNQGLIRSSPYFLIASHPGGFCVILNQICDEHIEAELFCFKFYRYFCHGFN